jgi:phosphoglycolate phosphatase
VPASRSNLVPEARLDLHPETLRRWAGAVSKDVTKFGLGGRNCSRTRAIMQTIVFDLDGTLVDTAPDLIDTLNYILKREGIAPVPFDRARTAIGGGVKRLLERSLAQNSTTVAPAELDKLYADYLEHYAAHIADRSRPFPGLDRALDGLSARGYRLAVCTNKLEWLSVRLLELLDLKHRFAAICGQDTFKVAKPNPDVLRKTVIAAGGDPVQAIMIGDSVTDIAAARAAGIPVIAVDFGYTDTPVAALNPDCVISTFDELVAAIDGLVQPIASAI